MPNRETKLAKRETKAPKPLTTCRCGKPMPAGKYMCRACYHGAVRDGYLTAHRWLRRMLNFPTRGNTLDALLALKPGERALLPDMFLDAMESGRLQVRVKNVPDRFSSVTVLRGLRLPVTRLENGKTVATVLYRDLMQHLTHEFYGTPPNTFGNTLANNTHKA